MGRRLNKQKTSHFPSCIGKNPYKSEREKHKRRSTIYLTPKTFLFETDSAHRICGHTHVPVRVCASTPASARCCLVSAGGVWSTALLIVASVTADSRPAEIADLERRLHVLVEPDARRLACLCAAARELCRVDPARATGLATEARNLAQNLRLPREELRAVGHLGWARLFAEDFDAVRTAIAELERHARFGTELDAARLAALRAALFHATGDIDRALAEALEGLGNVERGPNAAGSDAATLHNLVGTILVQLAEVGGAIEHFTQAQHILDSLGRGQAAAALAVSIGMAYREIGDHDGAVAAFESALRRTNDLTDVHQHAIVLGHLGLVLAEGPDPARAQAPLQEGLALCEQLGTPGSIGTIHHALGVAEHALGRLHTAEEHFSRSVAARIRAGEQLDIAESRICRAQLLYELGRDNEARDELADIVSKPATSGWARLQSQAWEVLYRINRRAGNLSAALDAHVAFHEHARRVTDERNQARQQALAIRFHVAQIAREREVEQQRSQEFERLAYTDQLTGLGNRRFFDQHLARAVRRALDDGDPLSVAMIDLDYFKNVNDRYSHALGDVVLRTAASVLHGQLRSNDTIGRFGGEEFTVTLVGATACIAERACERLRAAVASFPWHTIAPGLELTASFGVAQLSPNEDATQLLARADAALYRAKKSGRNRVEVG